MLLAINIGNTVITAGIFETSEPLCAFTIGSDQRRTTDEYALLFDGMLKTKGQVPKNITEVIIGSVVPTLTERIKQAIICLFGISPTIVGPGVKTGFRIQLNDPTELGADLAANAAGAIDLFGAPVIICELGAATAINVVDDKKAFLGGALLPGVGASMNALTEAALLPSVSAECPLSPLGRTTAECMNAGVIYGQAAAVTELIRCYREQLSLSESVPVAVTGEYAEKLIPYLGAKVTHVPLLTLRGLRAISGINRAKKQRSQQ